MPVAVAGWALVVAGTGHLALTLTSLLGPVPDGERAARSVMGATVVTLGGVDRDLWQLFVGFSVTMGVLLVGVGGLVVLALRHAPDLVDSTRAVLALLLGVLLAGTTTAALLLPSPPIVLLGAASLAVALALRHPSRAATGSSGPGSTPRAAAP
ncbi:LIC_13387 family protein [Cellulomonas bogoriensis]|uniref:Uncharacterized protein n=1 Tax=Cellulomonas bogoriensis 69B4 = DSM 16987 TaxID=1386082 RepID=A0A0A0BPR0_9CELL|nr:hypothetical protein [Cellulomonas bogoriensis]KGM09642.1 hypothetical protein N869_06395 [Cellulomonas bogoriensis 69B4 = DSM 16987]